MGNPAAVKKMKSEKRRKKYEQRLGPGVYLPKAEREQVNAEVEKLVKEAAARKKAATAKKADQAKAKPAAKPAAEAK